MNDHVHTLRPACGCGYRQWSLIVARVNHWLVTSRPPAGDPRPGGRVGGFVGWREGVCGPESVGRRVGRGIYPGDGNLVRHTPSAGGVATKSKLAAPRRRVPLHAAEARVPRRVWDTPCWTRRDDRVRGHPPVLQPPSPPPPAFRLLPPPAVHAFVVSRDRADALVIHLRAAAHVGTLTRGAGKVCSAVVGPCRPPAVPAGLLGWQLPRAPPLALPALVRCSRVGCAPTE